MRTRKSAAKVEIERLRKQLQWGRVRENAEIIYIAYPPDGST